MRDIFPPGFWGSGSTVDPEPDVLLPEGTAEQLLDGPARGPGIPEELAPLADALAALRAAPVRSELQGQEQALAAFRALRAAGAIGGSDRLAHTLGMPRDAAGRRPARARHRAPAGTGHRAGARGGGRRERRRPPVGRRLMLTVATAAAFAVIVGAFAYSGRLPGPIQGVAHVAIGAPSAKTSPTTSHPGTPTAGGGGVSGASATRMPPRMPPRTAPPTPSPPTTTAVQQRTVPQMCLAYFKNPWRPGVKSWDEDDWVKLVADARSPWLVWGYCLQYLRDSRGQLMPGVDPVPGYQDGPWSTAPPSKNPDQGGTQGGNNGQGGNGQGNLNPVGARNSNPDAGNPAPGFPATPTPATGKPATTKYP